MTEKYLKVIEILGGVIATNEIDIDLLKYENKVLEEKLKLVEQYINYYECENNASNTKI